MEWCQQAFLRNTSSFVQEIEIRVAAGLSFRQPLNKHYKALLHKSCVFAALSHVFSDPTWHFLLCLYRTSWDQAVKKKNKTTLIRRGPDGALCTVTQMFLATTRYSGKNEKCKALGKVEPILSAMGTVSCWLSCWQKLPPGCKYPPLTV